MEKITIKTPEDAKPYIGRKVRLWYHDGVTAYARGEGILRGGPALTTAPGRYVVGVGDDGFEGCGRGGPGGTAVYFGNGVWFPEESAQIELLDACPVAAPERVQISLAPLDTLADRLKAARAEVTRLEAEIAREAEDARYPLPVGYRWIEADCVEDSDGFSIEIDHAESDRHISGPLDPDGTPILSIEDPDDHGVMISARLDVVRALIARYDAQHGASDAKPEPYFIDVTGWCSAIPHTFKSGDVVDLTFASGREERHTIDVDDDGDLLTRRAYIADSGYSAALVGCADGRGVIKVTLISRGAQ